MSTTGRFAVITDENILVSCWFGGDMYFEYPGWGLECMKRLARVNSLKDLEKELKEFDHNFSLNRQWGLDEKELKDFSYTTTAGYSKEKGILELNEDTYDEYGKYDDYLYLKNLSSKPVKIITGDEYEDDEDGHKGYPRIGTLPCNGSCSIALYGGGYFDPVNNRQGLEFELKD